VHEHFASSQPVRVGVVAGLRIRYERTGATRQALHDPAAAMICLEELVH
jgi:hypothetical protein